MTQRLALGLTLCIWMTGCAAVAVVDTAVTATTAVVGTAVDVTTGVVGGAADLVVGEDDEE